jgi:hypothetical protein
MKGVPSAADRTDASRTLPPGSEEVKLAPPAPSAACQGLRIKDLWFEPPPPSSKREKAKRGGARQAGGGRKGEREKATQASSAKSNARSSARKQRKKQREKATQEATRESKEMSESHLLPSGLIRQGPTSWQRSG